MSCEGKDIHQIPMEELQIHHREHWCNYLTQQSNFHKDPSTINQAIATVELHHARALLAEIGARDSESYHDK